MRIHMLLNDKMKYSAQINGALAGWDNEAKKESYLILFGWFPVGDELVEQYTIHFRNDIAFSLCKKLEKEGMADLATDYIRSFVVAEDCERKIEETDENKD